MAAVEVVMPPPPHQPAPVVRVSWIALAATDTVVCLWIASLWVLLASFAAALVRLLACGWGCTGAAWTAVLVSLLFVALVWPSATLQLSKSEEAFHYINQLENQGAAALEPISEAVVMAHIIATTAFGFLEAFGFLLKLVAFATKDPPTDRIASVTMVVPPLGMSAMPCIVSLPVLAVRVWRMRRHARASVVPI